MGWSGCRRGQGDEMIHRVGVLDDHRSFGEAIGLALSAFEDIENVGVVSTIDALVALAVEHEPSVLLIDYQLSGATGIDCAVRLKATGISARLILLTAHTSDHVTSEALANGFERVMSKESPLKAIVNAVRSESLQINNQAKDLVRFSRRQREVLELMGQGLDPASIAEQLFISVHTSRSHVKDVLRIVGATTQLAAVTKAIREGYLLPPSKNDKGQPSD